MEEIQELLVFAARDCVPQDINSFDEFQLLQFAVCLELE
ncbi:hypothetical protein CASFOL_017088 [Castilleja foliolosa]|uniref:Uncharacterized protein n=1 Tax=Castilleja foliolosa TaxID=1961234 RepID=A0ABD3DC65_9LAMI